MKNERIILLIVAVFMTVGNVFALDGSWRGNLNVGFSKLPLVLHFAEQDGVTTCTMDSPNQNAYGLPISVEYVSNDSVSISSSSIGAKFAGRVTDDEIDGQFSQRGLNFPLTLTRERPLLERRPQTPQPPFPYQSIDTTFLSTDSTLLAGTFVTPANYQRGKTPMCVLVTGSGPQNRDEEIFEHRPFAIIADYLARNGVATFRYDDRGTAASEGDFTTSTIDTFAQDAKAALQFAKSYCAGPTGIIGHSEGGTIAMLLAQEGLPDFVISLAGMAVSGKETILAQNEQLLQKTDLDTTEIENVMVLISTMFDEIMRQHITGESAPIDVDAMAADLGLSVPKVIMKNLRTSAENKNAYLGALLLTDARIGMQAISCPLLALNGTLDTQVDADKNLSAIEHGIKNAKIVKMQGLNHLFQHATTGETKEYGEIRETISPEALSIMLQFLQALD